MIVECFMSDLQVFLKLLSLNKEPVSHGAIWGISMGEQPAPEDFSTHHPHPLERTIVCLFLDFVYVFPTTGPQHSKSLTFWEPQRPC